MFKLTFHYLKCVQQQETDLTGGDEVELVLMSVNGVGGISLYAGTMQTDGIVGAFLENDIEFSGTPSLTLFERDQPDVGDADESAVWTVEDAPGAYGATFSLDDGLYALSYSVAEMVSEPTTPAPDEPADDAADPGVDPDRLPPPGQILAAITSGTDVPESQRFDEYKAIIQSVGKYPFLETEGLYNLIGLRGLVQPSRTIVDNDAEEQLDKWDDTIAAVWMEGSVKRVHEFKASCDPGKHLTMIEGGKYAHADGIAHLLDGQWAYLTGYHQGKYPCLKQAEDFTVWRSKYRDEDGGYADNQYDSDETTYVGNFGINIHAGGDGDQVDNWSVGCQNIWGGKGAGTPYADLMGSGTTSASAHGGFVAIHFASAACPTLGSERVIYYTLVTVREKTGSKSEDALGTGDAGDAVVDCPYPDDCDDGADDALESIRKFLSGLKDRLLSD